MPNGGHINIRTEREETDLDPRAIIHFSDTGCGIPESIRENIFESFLSGRHEGSGLGLGIVKRILKSHHGDIQLEDTSSKGTTFKLWR